MTMDRALWTVALLGLFVWAMVVASVIVVASEVLS